MLCVLVAPSARWLRARAGECEAALSHSRKYLNRSAYLCSLEAACWPVKFANKPRRYARCACRRSGDENPGLRSRPRSCPPPLRVSLFSSLPSATSLLWEAGCLRTVSGPRPWCCRPGSLDARPGPRRSCTPGRSALPSTLGGASGGSRQRALPALAVDRDQASGVSILFLARKPRGRESAVG